MEFLMEMKNSWFYGNFSIHSLNAKLIRFCFLMVEISINRNVINPFYYLLKIIQKFWLVESGGWNRHIRSVVAQIWHELWHDHRILKTHIRHYDVICSYIENTYTTLWRHTNLCGLCQMRKNTNGRLLQGKGLQIQINNKTYRRIWGIIKAEVCVICRSRTQRFVLSHSTSFNNCLIT